jgi:hypothetical protein
MRLLHSKIFWFVAAILMAACGLWIANKVLTQQNPSSEVSAPMIVRNIGSYPSAIRSALFKKIISKSGTEEISLSEIKKFDLNLPQSLEYNEDEDWSIFSQKDALDIEGYEIIKSAVSQRDNQEYILTLSNRIADMGTGEPELLAILPHIKREVCQAVIKNRNDLSQMDNPIIVSLDRPPNLTPHPQVVEESAIVTLPRNLRPSAGCVENGGIYYYYQLIYEF